MHKSEIEAKCYVSCIKEKQLGLLWGRGEPLTYMCKCAVLFKPVSIPVYTIDMANCSQALARIWPEWASVIIEDHYSAFHKATSGKLACTCCVLKCMSSFITHFCLFRMNVCALWWGHSNQRRRLLLTVQTNGSGSDAGFTGHTSSHRSGKLIL